jgi:hypothetical protein
VLVEKLVVTRGLSTALIEFTTSRPMRAILTYWRTDVTNAPRHAQREGGAAGTSHAIGLEQLDPEAEYAAQAAFVDDDLESSRSAPIVIPSAVTILNETLTLLREIDQRRLVSLLRSLSVRIGEGRDARRARVRAMLAPEVTRLASIATRFAPLAARLFTSGGVFLRDKVRVYELLTVADHLDRFCEHEGVGLVTGPGGMDRGPLRLADRELLREPEVVPLPIPAPPAFMSAGGTIADASLFGKHTGVSIPFRVTGLAGVSRAEVELSLRSLSPLQYFEVRVNDAVDLVVHGRAVGENTPQKFFHHLDPALLMEGANRITLTLHSLPGLMSLDTPWVDGMSMRLERRRN